MILTAIYSIFCIGEVWTPVDLFKIDIPKHLKEQQLVKAIKQATSFLEKQGLSIVKLWQKILPCKTKCLQGCFVAPFFYSVPNRYLLLHQKPPFIYIFTANCNNKLSNNTNFQNLCCNRSLRFYLLHICLTHRPGSILCPSVPIFRQARACLVALSPETRG